MGHRRRVVVRIMEPFNCRTYRDQVRHIKNIVLDARAQQHRTPHLLPRVERAHADLLRDPARDGEAQDGEQ